MKNMIREEQELLVKQLGIFELRGLARELGIPSPTTKKRDELIKLILLKFENGDIVDDKGKRKGRPCKKLSTINDIVSTIANQFNEKNAQPLVFETLVTFAQVLPTYEKNIKEDENQYMMEVEIPGFEKQNITVDFENGYLTVEAKKEQANEEKEENAQPKYLHRERVESYSRSYYLGDVDATNIKARYENGVLTLNVPKQKANNTHKIVID